ncbi:MAG TPA: hypothetical protein VG406_20355 [Isosphaeraceae bacterium]|nr:hypothetical protein [Isosphaeraceae bacterium]
MARVPTERWVGFGALANVALLAVGVVRTPTALTASRNGPLGLGAALGMLALYAWLVRSGPLSSRRNHDGAVDAGAKLGLALGAFFAAQVLVEYIIPVTPRIDSALGMVVFGSLPIWFLASGIVGGRRGGSVRAGIASASLTAVFGTLAWFLIILLSLEAFRGTPQQERVLNADMVVDDFRRSGMTDFRAFVLQDYWGGGFFHMLLSPILATPFGALGGWLRSLGRRAEGRCRTAR